MSRKRQRRVQRSIYYPSLTLPAHQFLAAPLLAFCFWSLKTIRVHLCPNLRSSVDKEVKLNTPMSPIQTLHGCLLGGALGDALGLPFEGLSSKKRRRIWGEEIERGLDMSFLPHRGMISDDTEHALFTARALLESRGNSDRFGRVLASELRHWFLTFPPGTGLATLRAGFKALLFLPFTKTGVHSAGNGPAMRAPILGAFFGDGTAQLREFCRISTRLTHTDPKAEWGAFTIALATAHAAQGQTDGRRFVRDLSEWSDDSEAAREMISLAKRAVNSAARGQSALEFCDELELQNGVTGYIFHTVPVVLQCWLRHSQNFRAGVEEIILCGGDSDSTGAILGGILGASMGADALPPDWTGELWDWPNSPKYIARVASELSLALEEGSTIVAPRVLFGTPLLRNAFFLAVVLTHAARRILPF
ncbi:ADP-ribosyl-[dinitrogen reductase] glycohydrolase [Abditibacteriota bacterium]|nr:ADP-ribosyl-[dinitrogen reductase] glycohydrolase [Abditibacteriota bacterium]